jgi:septal ring factor EnvC (AmiA/AmiB activator)
MTENVENLILEHLKLMRTELGAVRLRVDEIHDRLNGLERHVSRIARDDANTYAELIEDRHRVDALVKRLERIERRLELED